MGSVYTNRNQHIVIYSWLYIVFFVSERVLLILNFFLFSIRWFSCFFIDQRSFLKCVSLKQLVYFLSFLLMAMFLLRIWLYGEIAYYIIIFLFLLTVTVILEFLSDLRDICFSTIFLFLLPFQFNFLRSILNLHT